MSENPIFQTILFTTLAINLMLGGLIFTAGKIPIYSAVPAVEEIKNENHVEIDYQMEPVGIRVVNDTPTGMWVVEKYQEYEVSKDKYQRILSRKPTSKEEYVRYWRNLQ